MPSMAYLVCHPGGRRPHRHHPALPDLAVRQLLRHQARHDPVLRPVAGRLRLLLPPLPAADRRPLQPDQGGASSPSSSRSSTATTATTPPAARPASASPSAGPSACRSCRVVVLNLVLSLLFWGGGNTVSPRRDEPMQPHRPAAATSSRASARSCSLVGATTVGVKCAFGAFDGGYELVADFDAAGQGLIEGSDVKVRGVNIGHVAVDRAASTAGPRVTMFIDDGDDVPARHARRSRSGPRRSSARSSSTSMPGADEGDAARTSSDGDAVPPHFDDGDLDCRRGTFGDAWTDGPAHGRRLRARAGAGRRLSDPPGDRPERARAPCSTSWPTAGDGLGRDDQPVDRRHGARSSTCRPPTTPRPSSSSRTSPRSPTSWPTARARPRRRRRRTSTSPCPSSPRTPTALDALLVAARAPLERRSPTCSRRTPPFIDVGLRRRPGRARHPLRPPRPGHPARRRPRASTSRSSASVGRIPVGDGTLMAAVKGILGGDALRRDSVQRRAPTAGPPAHPPPIRPCRCRRCRCRRRRSLPPIDLDALARHHRRRGRLGRDAVVDLARRRTRRAALMLRTAIKFGVFVGGVPRLHGVARRSRSATSSSTTRSAATPSTLTATFDDVTGLLDQRRREDRRRRGRQGHRHPRRGRPGRRHLPASTTTTATCCPSTPPPSIRWRNLIGQRFLYLHPGDGLDRCSSRATTQDRPTPTRSSTSARCSTRLGPIVAAIDEGQVNEFLETVTAALDGNADELGQTLDDLATAVDRAGQSRTRRSAR